MATVSLDRITKSFGAFTALHDLSLDIEDREFLVLLGPSGCGKTTTMRMIAGLEDPTTGDIRIDGERVNDKPARDRDLAMVFQNYGLYPHMTVADNIGYPLKVRGMARRGAARADKGGRRARGTFRSSRAQTGGALRRSTPARGIGARNRAYAPAVSHGRTAFNLDAKLRNLMRAQLKHLQRISPSQPSMSRTIRRRR